MTALTPAASFAVAAVGLALVAAVLASGLVDRRAVSATALFLGLGIGIGLLATDVPLQAPVVAVGVTIGIALIVLTDALGVDLRDLRGHRRLVGLTLGFGTLLPGVILAVAAWLILGMPPALAAMQGAALATIDPLATRALLRRPHVSGPARVALPADGALGRLIALPVIFAAVAAVRPDFSAQRIPALVLDAILLGPLVGGLVSLLALLAYETTRRGLGVRRDVEPLAVFGVAALAFAAAELINASGLTAVFGAGVVIATVGQPLSQSVRDGSEAVVDVVLLLALTGLGALAVRYAAPVTPALAGFAVIALAIRPLVLGLALAPGRSDGWSRAQLAWFGPRALAALLFAMLPGVLGAPGAEQLLRPTAVVVVASVVVHAFLLVAWQRRLGARAPAPPPELITIGELRELVAARDDIRLLDVRAGPMRRGDLIAAGAVRLDPDHPVVSAAALALPRHAWLVAYCA
jgi:cell volume regulation protein A